MYRAHIPLISVVLVAWNSGTHLSHCLGNLRAQTLQDFEIILVDNGSTDLALDDLESLWPESMLRLVKMGKNEGFAVANNIGARLAKGKWLVLLNTDAFPEPDWLERLTQAAENNPEFTFFASRQIQANNPQLLDGTGDAYHVSGLAWRQNYNQLASGYGKQPIEIFSACAAAALYSLDDFMEIGGFDEDYFSYFEDVDLSFRLRLTGRRCCYVPEAIVYHVGSASTGKTSDFSLYYGHRNLVWTFFKDMPPTLFWIYLPLHMLMNIYLSFSFLFKERRSIVFKSKIDAFRVLPAILRKRKFIQLSRIVSTTEIYRLMTKELFAPLWISSERSKRKQP